MLHRVDFEIKHANTGGFLREQLGYAPGSVWGNALATMIRRQIIMVEKANPKRSKEIRLNIAAIIREAQIEKPYITPRVLDTMRAGNSDASAAETDTTTTTIQQSSTVTEETEESPIQPPSEPMPVAAEAEEAPEQPHPAPPLSSTPTYHMSARTRRALEDGPQTLPGYRTDGKQPHRKDSRPIVLPPRHRQH